MTRARKVFIVLVFSLGAIVVLATFVGPGLGFDASVRALAAEATGGDVAADARAILVYRLTRVGAAICVGAALAMAGVALQALLRNPLADPYILGIAAGGGFGAAVATALGLGTGIAAFSATNGFAFAGALAAVAVGLVVARGAGILSVHGLLLAGVMVGAFFTSLILLIMAVVPTRDQHAVFLWLMGDLGSADITPAKVALCAALVATEALFLAGAARALDVIAQGEETAFHLGLAVERFKVAVLAAASLATAAAVALVGPIGFVGLVVPHALRRLIGPRHLPLIITSALGGAALVTLGDTLVRFSADYFQLPIIPVGVFTALVGAPYFLGILRRRDAR